MSLSTTWAHLKTNKRKYRIGELKFKKLGDKHKFTRSTATSATQWYAPINSGRIRIYGNWNKNIKLINILLATQEKTSWFIMDFIFRACLRQRESGVRSEIKSLVTKIDLVLKIAGLWSGVSIMWDCSTAAIFANCWSTANSASLVSEYTSLPPVFVYTSMW